MSGRPSVAAQLCARHRLFQQIALQWLPRGQQKHFFHKLIGESLWHVSPQFVSSPFDSSSMLFIVI